MKAAKTEHPDPQRAKLTKTLVYGLFGNESVRRNELLEQILKLHGIEKNASLTALNTFDAKEKTWVEILDEVACVDLFSARNSAGPKLVFIRNSLVLGESQGFLTDLTKRINTLSRLSSEEIAQEPAIFIFESAVLDQRRKLSQMLKKANALWDCTSPKDFERSRWIRYLVSQTSLEFEPSLLEWFSSFEFETLSQVVMELQKLELFLSPSLVATKDALVSVVFNGAQTSIFDLCRAVLENKKVRALILSARLIESQEQALGFVGALLWSLKNRSSETAPNQKQKILRNLLLLDERLKSSGEPAPRSVDYFLSSL